MVNLTPWTSFFPGSGRRKAEETESSALAEESFELRPLTLPSSAHLGSTSNPAFPWTSRFCSTEQAVGDARIQAAGLLWPAELLDAASSSAPSKTRESHHASGKSKVSKLPCDATVKTAGVAKGPDMHSFKDTAGAISDLMQASFHTAASQVTCPPAVGNLSQQVIDAVSLARKEIDDYLDRKGLSTQGTTPLRKREYPAGTLDPRKVETPLHPQPHSLKFSAAPSDHSDATDLGRLLTLDHQVRSSLGAYDWSTVATAVELLEATQCSEIAAWQEHQRPNKEISEMLRNFGLLGTAYAGGNLDSAEHRAAVNLLCWTFKQEQGEGDSSDYSATCGERMEGLIKDFGQLNRDMFENQKLVPQDASPGDVSRFLRFRMWNGVPFWKECEMPWAIFQQIQTAFQDTYQAIKELLRGGTWNKEISKLLSDILHDVANVRDLLPEWRSSDDFKAEASAQDVWEYYDSLVPNMPDPSAYTPLLSELFFALQRSQGVKVSLSDNHARAWTARDKDTIRLPRTHRFRSSPPRSGDHRSEHSSPPSV